MPAESSDSIEVIQFMAAFHRAKEACDDDPRHLVGICESDSAFRDEILALHRKYRAVGKDSPTHVYPVNPGFISLLRDFQKRYLPTIRKIRRDWIVRDGGFWQLGDSQIHVDEIHNRIADARLREIWAQADKIAQEDTYCIDLVFETAEELTNSFDLLTEHEYEASVRDFQNGIDIMRSLNSYFETRAVSRRRYLLPSVMLPRDIRLNANDAIENPLVVAIDEAQRSFVFGMFGSVYAMLRTIMEHMVYQQYGSRVDEFARALASPLLPPTVDKKRLDCIRRTANSILHQDHLASIRGDVGDICTSEIEILRDMIVVRDLVESYRKGHGLRAV